MLWASAGCSSRVRSGLLQAWDFFHAPAGTEHIFVGAGAGPCVILMAGGRSAAVGGLLPGVGARGALRREREGGDARPRHRHTWGSSRRGASGPRTRDRLPWA